MIENEISVKSRHLGNRIVKLHKYLIKKKEYTISTQVLRSGTSIGANIIEGIYAQSRADFISKYSIALKECAETIYWLQILHDNSYIQDKEFDSIYSETEEMLKILISSVNTAKKNLQESKMK